MKNLHLMAVLCCGLFVVAPLAVSAQPAAKAGKAAKGGKKAKFGAAIKEAEKVAGKPLTDAQKAAVRAAAAERAKAMKPITEKYRTAVAKSLGLTLDQYEAKLKAARKNK